MTPYDWYHVLDRRFLPPPLLRYTLQNTEKREEIENIAPESCTSNEPRSRSYPAQAVTLYLLCSPYP